MTRRKRSTSLERLRSDISRHIEGLRSLEALVESMPAMPALPDIGPATANGAGASREVARSDGIGEEGRGDRPGSPPLFHAAAEVLETFCFLRDGGAAAAMRSALPLDVATDELTALVSTTFVRLGDGDSTETSDFFDLVAAAGDSDLWDSAAVEPEVRSRALRSAADAEFWASLGEVLRSSELPDARYELHGEIARGGTSRVFEGRDRLTDQPAAVKLVIPRASESTRAGLELAQRRLPASLSPVVALGELGAGGLYVVMPLIRGAPLDALLDATAGSIGAPLLALRRICASIAAAHREGVVHRDLKPSNVRVLDDGEVAVLDWGLACAAGEVARGAVAGTPAYMAPEQWRGEAVTERTDVWALGVLLYRVVAGVTPVEAGRWELEDGAFSPAAAALSYSPPPPSRLRESRLPPIDRAIAEELDRIALRCLEKDPEARYADAGELLADLEGA